MKAPAGQFVDSSNALFPVVSYQTFVPIRMSPETQVIALGDGSFLVSESHQRLTWQLLVAVCHRPHSPKYLLRAAITLANIFR